MTPLEKFEFLFKDRWTNFHRPRRAWTSSRINVPCIFLLVWFLLRNALKSLVQILHYIHRTLIAYQKPNSSPHGEIDPPGFDLFHRPFPKLFWFTRSFLFKMRFQLLRNSASSKPLAIHPQKGRFNFPELLYILLVGSRLFTSLIFIQNIYFLISLSSRPPLSPPPHPLYPPPTPHPPYPRSSHPPPPQPEGMGGPKRTKLCQTARLRKYGPVFRIRRDPRQLPQQRSS